MIEISQSVVTVLVVAIIVLLCFVAWLAFVMGEDVEREKWARRVRAHDLLWTIRKDNRDDRP